MLFCTHFIVPINSTNIAIIFISFEIKFKNSSYGEFKIEVGETVVSYLEPLREKYESLSDGDISSLIRDHLDDVKDSAKKTMDEVSAIVGV